MMSSGSFLNVFEVIAIVAYTKRAVMEIKESNIAAHFLMLHAVQMVAIVAHRDLPVTALRDASRINSGHMEWK